MRFTFITREDPVSDQIKNYLFKKLSMEWEYDNTNPELLISIGGDGTLLRGIHKYIKQLETMQVVGLHTGTLGFLTDYTKEELDVFVHDILKKKPKIEEASLLEIDMPSKGIRLFALNEIRIESLEKTLSLAVYIDDEFFELSNGSGICISTQSGSTAVNRALSGAVIDSGLSVLQLCEIMPIAHKNHHSLRNPYIMNDNRIITITGSSLSYAKACYDHLSIDLKDVSMISVKTSDKKVRFARYRPYSYLRRLKNLY